MLRHLRQWSKNFGFGSALSHNSGAANTILFTIQTFNEHSRMAKLSQRYLRGHMRWNVTSLQIQLGLIGTYNFGRLSTLKSNILSTKHHLRQWSKNFGVWHRTFTQFWRCKYDFVYYSNQTFNEHSRMAKLSQPYLRGHMRWNVTSLQVQLGLIGTYNFGRLSTLKSNILSTRKLKVLWPILWHISLTST